MLFTTRMNNTVTAYPKLSRVWIRTGDPRTPLKGVWINESKLDCVIDDVHAARHDDEPAELSDEHLCPAKWNGGRRRSHSECGTRTLCRRWHPAHKFVIARELCDAVGMGNKNAPKREAKKPPKKKAR